MKNNYSKINNLKRFREKCGLTLEKLSAKSKVSLYELHKLENDRVDIRSAKFSTIIAICSALEISIYDLFVDVDYAKTLLPIVREKYKKL